MKMWLHASLLAGGIAHADPCPEEALTRQILVEHPTIVAFCEPCGDRVPGDPQRWSGEQVDPAYTYVQTGTARYDNLAALEGCPAPNVAPSLRVEEAAEGVLIVPDQTAPSPVAPRMLVVEKPTRGVGWAEIAIGCGATSALWIAVMRWRRRRAHRPRLG